MAAGRFFCDTAAQKLYVWLADGSDPNASFMEASTRRRDFFDHRGGVYLKGLTFRRSNNNAYDIFGQAVTIAANSIIENCDIQWADFAGLPIRDNCQVINCILSNNGNTGLGANTAANILVTGNTGEYNYYRHFNDQWHAGGMKIIPDTWGTVENNEVAYNYASGVPFTAQVDDGNGSLDEYEFSINVSLAWRNQRDPRDVDDNGAVEAADALALINRLNLGHGGALSVPPAWPNLPPPYWDVSGDNNLTPLDALRVINYLNSHLGALGSVEANSGSVLSSLGGEPAGRPAGISALYGDNPSVFSTRSISLGGSLTAQSLTPADAEPVSLLGNGYISKTVSSFDDGGSIGSGKLDEGLFRPLLRL